MRAQDRNDDMTGYDPQTWKNERRRKLERRSEDRRVQLARRRGDKHRYHKDDEDIITGEDE